MKLHHDLVNPDVRSPSPIMPPTLVSKHGRLTLGKGMKCKGVFRIESIFRENGKYLGHNETQNSG